MSKLKLKDQLVVTKSCFTKYIINKKIHYYKLFTWYKIKTQHISMLCFRYIIFSC